MATDSRRQFQGRREAARPAVRGRARLAGCVGMAAAMWLLFGPTEALAGNKHCSDTTKRAHKACEHEVQDDYFIAQGICINVSDSSDRKECFDDAKATRKEERNFCKEQRDSRKDVCAILGQDRYDPDWDPADFDDDFTNLTTPNNRFPLDIGNQWIYEGGDEVITIDVLDETKLIEGVTCLVVNDVVEEDGEVVEDTNDWFAAHEDGDTWYCGEEVQDFETFDGDDPDDPELVSIEGSFKVGRDGDKGGILFPGDPMPGDAYRQEWSLGNAEDFTQVLSNTYGWGADEDLDEFAPQDLVELLCSNDDCVVTLDWSPLDPGVVEYKYYAPILGFFLEVKPDDGEIVQLVDCNFHALCDSLPTP